MATLLALLPILLLVILLIGARWSAAAAGLAAAAAAAAIALLFFDFGEGDVAAALGGTAIEATFLAATILWIIYPALCVHEYQTASGAIATFGQWLSRLADDRRLSALLVAWFFALFLEGAAGFGTPVALAAPLLVGLGFSPVRALVLVLIGHAVGVSFGAVGTPLLALLAVAPLDPAALSLAVALLHAALGWMLVPLLIRMAGEGATAHLPRARWWWSPAAAAAFFIPSVLLAWTVGPELPTLGGALIGGLAFIMVLRWAGAGTGADEPALESIPLRRLLAAAAPYLIVGVLILLTRLPPALAQALRDITVEWTLLGRFGGSFAPFYHPGSLLLLGLLLAALVRRDGLTIAAGAALRAAGRLPMVALALVAVLLLARLLVHSGMAAHLAQAAAGSLGGAWPLAAPAAGALGTFVTGSATASNLLFGDFQYSAAAAAGLPPLLVLAGQGFGAAIGNMVAPHNIVAGAATVGLVRQEGRVIRRTLLPCLLYVAAGGLLLFGAVAALR